MTKSESDKTRNEVSDTAIAVALGKSAGVLDTTARSLKMTRRALIERLDNSNELREARQEAIDINLDMVESKLIKAAQKGVGWAVRLYLTNIGRDRGYGKRLEISGNFAAVGEVHILELPDNGRNLDDSDGDEEDESDYCRQPSGLGLEDIRCQN